MKLIMIPIALLVLGACTPKPEAKKTPEATKYFGPNHTDVIRKQDKDAVKAGGTALTKLQGKILVADYFRLVHDLQTLGQQSDQTALLVRAKKLAEKYYQSPQVLEEIDFASSPYVQALVGFTKDEAVATIQALANEMNSDLQKISDWSSRVAQQTQWPTGQASLQEQSAFLRLFLYQQLVAIGSLNISPTTQKAIQSEMKIKIDQGIELFAEKIQPIDTASTLQKLLIAVKQLMFAFDYEASAERMSLISRGLDLGDNIQSMQTPQNALSVLVDLWRILSPEQRKLFIEPENKEFYEYMSERTEGDLDCLRREKCSWFLVGVMAKSVILPKIEEYGVENLRNKLNGAMIPYVRHEVQNSVAEALRGLPQTILQGIQAGFSSHSHEIANILNHYSDFVMEKAQAWAGVRFQKSHGRVFGLDPNQIMVKWQNGEIFLGPASSQRDTGAEALGAVLYSGELISDDEDIAWYQIIHQMNKLLMLGGFRLENGMAGALAQPLLKEQRQEELNIFKVATNPVAFAVPDLVNLRGPFQFVKQNGDSKVSVRGQSALLQGIANSMSLFRDWQESPFDRTLGKVRLNDVMADIPESIGGRKVFPKNSMFALSVANGAVILNNLLKDLTPIFVLSEQSRIIWANEYDFTDSEAAAMAGVVDIFNGDRSQVVQARDLSTYLLALRNFLAASEGIEKTESPSLREKDSEGKSPIERIVESRSKVRLLMIGLANFLSHRMTGSDGLVQSQYSLQSKSLVQGSIDTMNQVYAIEALIHAHEVTKLPNYIWSALDIYYGMNRELFDEKIGFYRGVSNASDLARALAALGKLQNHLSGESLAQFQQMRANWTGALQMSLGK